MVAPLPRVRLRLLGPAQIEHDGELIEKLGSQKSLILLAYLIRHPHEHSRAKLASLLWLDQAQSKARSNLRWALNNLSKLVPDVIAATRQTLCFTPHHQLWLDIDDFETFAASSFAAGNVGNRYRLDEMATAVSLYRGEFLEGIMVDDAPDLELWLLQEREYWRRRVVTLLERLIEGYSAQHEYYHAERFATQLLKHEPWREETHQQLMWLLTVTGQRSAALSQYETCRQILATELAVDPSPETIALYEKIRDHQTVIEELTTPHRPDQSDAAIHTAPTAYSGMAQHRQGRFVPFPQPIVAHSTDSAGDHGADLSHSVDRSVSKSVDNEQHREEHHGLQSQLPQTQLLQSHFVPTARATPVPHNLPRERTPLVGRQVELIELRDLLFAEERPLVTLIGEGGVGKSRLALAVADLLTHAATEERTDSTPTKYRHGIWFVPLVGIDNYHTLQSAQIENTKSLQDEPLDVEATATVETAIVTAIAAAMHLQFIGNQSPFQQLVDFLRRKETLLILDNMEHIVESALVLSDLLAEAPGLQLLVTSRIPLDLQEEWRYTIQGMALPETITGAVTAESLTTLQANSSIKLFVQTGQRVDHHFSLTAENVAQVVAICRHLHGLPLALELAATGLAQMSCRELAEILLRGETFAAGRLDDQARAGENSLDLLQTSMRNVPARHRAMRNVFAYSWQLLSTTEQQATMQLALFRGGADRGALVAITGKAQATFTELVHKSLVQRDGDGRFAMHELLRQFCLEQLTADAEQGIVMSTRQRHAIYYLQTLHEVETTVKGYDPQPLLLQLRRDLDNIRQAWQWALQQGYWTLIDQCLSGISRFYLLLGLLGEGRRLMRDAADALQTWLLSDRATASSQLVDKPLVDASVLSALRLRLLNTDIFFCNALADYDVAIATAETVAKEEADSAATEIAATAHLRWGEALWYKGEIEMAHPHLIHTLALLANSNRTPDQSAWEIKADALCVLGLIAVRKGDYTAATIAYEESHELSNQLSDAYRTGRALYSLGTVYRNQAHYSEARRYLAQGLTIARQTGDRHSESRVLNSLGDIELYQGNFREARQHYRHVANFAAIVGDRRSECIAQTNLGIVARDLGQYELALENLNESLTLARTIGFPRGEGWNLCCLSLLHHQQGNDREALRLAREALVLFDHLGDRLGQAFAQTNLGRAYLGIGSWQDAQRAFEATKALRCLLGQPHLAIEVTAGLATAAWGNGNQQQALAHINEIVDYLQGATLEGSEVPSTIYTTCYQILHALEDPRATTIREKAQKFHHKRAERLDGTEQQAYLAAIHQLSVSRPR